MKFGFVTNVLKTFGKAALPIAEDIGVTAANAALPGLGGILASTAVAGINKAIAKHGTAPASAPSPSDPTITVGQAKKFDVMQLLEANAPDIMDAILAGRKRAVVDRATFVEGADEIVEGFLKVMKSIGAAPSSTPPVDPVVITQALVAETRANPAPTPTEVPQIATVIAKPLSTFPGVVSNLEVPQVPSPLELATLLEQVVAHLRGQ